MLRAANSAICFRPCTDDSAQLGSRCRGVPRARRSWPSASSIARG